MIYRVSIESIIFEFNSLMEAAEFCLQAKDNSIKTIDVKIAFIKEDEK